MHGRHLEKLLIVTKRQGNLSFGQIMAVHSVNLVYGYLVKLPLQCRCPWPHLKRLSVWFYTGKVLTLHNG